MNVQIALILEFVIFLSKFPRFSGILLLIWPQVMHSLKLRSLVSPVSVELDIRDLKRKCLISRFMEDVNKLL